MVASRFPPTDLLHDSFIRVAKKMNELVEERMLQQLNKSVSLSHSSPDVAFNRTQMSIILDIQGHPEGPNTPTKIAQRLSAQPASSSKPFTRLWKNYA